MNRTTSVAGLRTFVPSLLAPGIIIINAGDVTRAHRVTAVEVLHSKQHQRQELAYIKLICKGGEALEAISTLSRASSSESFVPIRVMLYTLVDAALVAATRDS